MLVGWMWPILGGLTIQAVSLALATIAMMLLPAFTSGLSVLLFFIAVVVIELGVSYFLIPLMIALFTGARRVDRAVRACYAAIAMDLVWNAVWTWGLPERPAGLIVAVGLAYSGAKLGARWAKEEEVPLAMTVPTSPQTMW